MGYIYKDRNNQKIFNSRIVLVSGSHTPPYKQGFGGASGRNPGGRDPG